MVNNKTRVTIVSRMIVIMIILLVSSCASNGQTINFGDMITPLAPTPMPAPPSGRPAYAPGQLVDYTAQDGDTLPALAARFNTTVDQIMKANPIIPADA